MVRKPVDIKFKLNEKNKVSVYCKNECGWRLYASTISGEMTFQIKTFHPTCTCGRSFHHTHVTSAYVAQKYLEEFDKNPKWEVQGIHHVRKDIIVELTNSQTYRAKRKAREMLDGDERLEYAKLREYAEMIRSTNKGSHVILETEILDKGDERPIFNRMYIRYHVQKVGFLAGCRPIVRLDGCHLKGRFGGTYCQLQQGMGMTTYFQLPWL